MEIITLTNPESNKADTELLTALNAYHELRVTIDDMAPELALLLNTSVDTLPQIRSMRSYPSYDFTELLSRASHLSTDQLWEAVHEQGWITTEFKKQEEDINREPSTTHDVRTYDIRDAIVSVTKQRMFRDMFPDLDMDVFDQVNLQFNNDRENLEFSVQKLNTLLRHADVSIDYKNSKGEVDMKDYVWNMDYEVIDKRLHWSLISTEHHPEKLYEEDKAISPGEATFLTGSLRSMISAINETSVQSEHIDPDYSFNVRVQFTKNICQLVNTSDPQLNHDQSEKIETFKHAYVPGSDKVLFNELFRLKTDSQYDQFIADKISDGYTLSELVVRLTHGADLQYHTGETSYLVGSVAETFARYILEHQDRILEALNNAASNEISADDIKSSVDKALVLSLRIAKYGSDAGAKEYAGDGFFGGALAARENSGYKQLMALYSSKGIIDSDGTFIGLLPSSTE